MCEQGEIELLRASVEILKARIEAYQTALRVIREQRRDAEARALRLEDQVEQLKWLADLSADGD